MREINKLYSNIFYIFVTCYEINWWQSIFNINIWYQLECDLEHTDTKLANIKDSKFKKKGLVHVDVFSYAVIKGLKPVLTIQNKVNVRIEKNKCA